MSSLGVIHNINQCVCVFVSVQRHSYITHYCKFLKLLRVSVHMHVHTRTPVCVCVHAVIFIVMASLCLVILLMAYNRKQLMK